VLAAPGRGPAAPPPEEGTALDTVVRLVRPAA